MSLRRQAAGAEINSVISDSLSISCSIPDSPVDWRPITTHLPYRNRDRIIYSTYAEISTSIYSIYLAYGVFCDCDGAGNF